MVESLVCVVVKVDPVVARARGAAAAGLVVAVLIIVHARVARRRFGAVAGNLNRFGDHLAAQSCRSQEVFVAI